MKIVYLINSAIPSEKAQSIHVMQMCNAFSNNGHDVILIHPAIKSKIIIRTDDVFNYYGVNKNFKIKSINVIGKGRLAEQMFGIKCIKQLKRIKPDIIYSRSISAAFYAIFLNRKIIFESHQATLKGNRLIDKMQLIRIMKSKNLMRFVVISAALRRIYQKDWNDNEKIMVAHDAADEPLFNETGFELSGKNKKYNIGYFGSLFTGRGIEIIVQIASKLEEFAFHIIGGSGEILEYWRSETGNLDNIFFYGYLQPCMMSFIRNKCDILLAPYQKDVYVSDKKVFSTSDYMSPLKIFEYMSGKKAIVVSDLPVIREVCNESNSVLVAPDDPEAWVNAIKRLKEIKTREKIAECAFNDFKNQYTWNKRAESIINSII